MPRPPAGQGIQVLNSLTDRHTQHPAYEIDYVAPLSAGVALETVDAGVEHERGRLVDAALMRLAVEAAGLAAGHIHPQSGGDREDGRRSRMRVGHVLLSPRPEGWSVTAPPGLSRLSRAPPTA